MKSSSSRRRLLTRASIDSTPSRLDARRTSGMRWNRIDHGISEAEIGGAQAWADLRDGSLGPQRPDRSLVAGHPDDCLGAVREAGQFLPQAPGVAHLTWLRRHAGNQ